MDHWRQGRPWITVVIMICSILMGLVLLWWKSGRIAETSDTGTQNSARGKCVTLQGKAVHCRSALSIPLESTRMTISELVFSQRSKGRFGKARLVAAHWVVRTSFEPQSVLCPFPVFHRFLFHSCTQDFPVALALTITHHFNATHAIVPCSRAQTGIGASCCFGLDSELWLQPSLCLH